MPLAESQRRLVGRGQQIEALVGTLGRALVGEPRAVLVSGEAGIGKTRLLAESSAVAKGLGFRVLSGDCVGVGLEGVPYVAVAEVLRDLVTQLDRQEAGRLLRAGRAEFSKLVPELAQQPEASRGFRTPGEVEQLHFYSLFVQLLRDLAAATPVLLVIDDLHWSDTSTRQLLSFVLKRLNGGSHRLCVLGSYRSDAVSTQHPLGPYVAELARLPMVELLEVPPLSGAETGQLIAGLVGRTPHAAEVELIFNRTGGNPFFAEELTTELTGAVPRKLREVLLGRFAALSAEAQSVLRMASVAEHRLHFEVFSALATMPEATLIEALREAVDQRLLVVEGGGSLYAFRHALLRECIYDDLLPDARRRYHAACAQALAQRPHLAAGGRAGAAAELAWHFHSAGDARKAAQWAVRAAVAAEDVLAFPDALTHWERSLALWEAETDAEEVAGMSRTAVLERAAAAAMSAGLFERAIPHLEETLERVGSGEPLLRGRLLGELGLCLFSVARDGDALQALEEAEDLLPADTCRLERVRVQAKKAQVLLGMGRYEESQRCCEEALPQARAEGARAEVGHLLNTLGADIMNMGDPDAGSGLLEQARSIADETGEIAAMVRACQNLGLALFWGGRAREALRVTREGYALAERHGLDRQGGRRLANRLAELCLLLGHWTEAETCNRQAASRSQIGWFMVDHDLTEALLHAYRGRPEAAERHLSEARRLVAATQPWFASLYLAPYTGECAIWGGKPEAVIELVSDVLGRRPAEGIVETHTVLWLICLALRAQADLAASARTSRNAAARRKAITAADDLAAQAATTWKQQERFRTPPAAALYSHCAAERSRVERSVPELWEACAGTYDDLGFGFYAAYARWRLAEALLAGGAPRSAAADVVRAARAVAEALEARPLMSCLDELARRARLNVAAVGEPDAGVHNLGLTPRELEVLRLVAIGRSNQQIADELFISPRTAGVHVTNILRKLQVRSRVEAAAAAHRMGMVDP